VIQYRAQRKGGGEAVNPFVHKSAAERYALWRPYFHPEVVGRVESVLRLSGPLARALDVGCGTGQSCTALLRIAREVFGTDISSEMLSERTLHPRIRYVRAAAEDLPFPDARFDLITVSAAFHWFDQVAFLREAHRLLKPSGWLVVYNNYFAAVMEGNPDFGGWFSERYLKRYPSPPRRATTMKEEDAVDHGFAFLQRRQYSVWFEFTPETLANYLSTQSNVLQSVETGLEPLDDVLEWLRAELQPLFAS
jgi:SAM-dependent methyltransferase